MVQSFLLIFFIDIIMTIGLVIFTRPYYGIKGEYQFQSVCLNLSSWNLVGSRAPLNHSPARQWRVCSRIWRVKIAYLLTSMAGDIFQLFTWQRYHCDVDDFSANHFWLAMLSFHFWNISLYQSCRYSIYLGVFSVGGKNLTKIAPWRDCISSKFWPRETPASLFDWALK